MLGVARGASGGQFAEKEKAVKDPENPLNPDVAPRSVGHESQDAAEDYGYKVVGQRIPSVTLKKLTLLR